MHIRCMWYDENGNPHQDGCRRQGRGCNFVHPSDPQWASATPSRHQLDQHRGERGGARGRGRGLSRANTGSEWGPSFGSASSFTTGANSSSITPKSFLTPDNNNTSSFSSSRKEPEPDWGSSNTGQGNANADWGASNADWGASNADWGASNADWGAPNAGWGSPNADWGAKSTGWVDPNVNEGGGSRGDTGPDTNGSTVAHANPSAKGKSNNVPSGAGSLSTDSPRDAESWGGAGEGHSKPAAVDSWGTSTGYSEPTPVSASDIWGASRGYSKTAAPASASDTLVSPFAALISPTCASGTEHPSEDIGGGSARPPSPTPSTTDSSASGRTSREKFLETVAQTVHYMQKQCSLEEERNRIRKLQRSRQFVSAGERAIQRLEGMRKHNDQQLREVEKQLLKKQNILAAYPLVPPSSADDISVGAEDFKTYAEEVRVWLDFIRPVVQQLQAEAESSAGNKHKCNLSPVADVRDQPAVSETFAASAERMAAVEVRLEELESDLQELHASCLPKLHEQFNKENSGLQVDAEGSIERGRPAAPSPIEDGEVRPTPPTTGPEQCVKELSDKLEVFESQMKSARDDIHELKVRDAQGWHEHFGLRAEREFLKMELAEVQQNGARLQKDQDALDAELARLRKSFARLEEARSSPTPTMFPQFVFEELVERVSEDMVQPIRNDVKNTLDDFTQSIREAVRVQQETMYGKVSVTLQPTLSLVQSIQEYVETAKIAAMKQGQIEP
ncbi:hypothetical protein BKA93DRAFT_779438 [Sparassis latifolia]